MAKSGGFAEGLSGGLQAGMRVRAAKEKRAAEGVKREAATASAASKAQKELDAYTASPDDDYADGGIVKEDKSKRRKQLDKLEEDALSNYADGGSLGMTYSEKPEQEKMGGVSGKKVDNRDAGKRPTTPSPVIGPRAEFRTEVAALMADGGMLPQPMGYANGGMTFAGPVGNPVFGYTQHGSETVTSDPLWHMECHRDFGKKG